MTDPKASGPLWCQTMDDGYHLCKTVHWLCDGTSPCVPCRLLPGHGKWVPLELVEDVDDAIKDIDFDCDGTVYGLGKVRAAIKAALEGAV